MKQKVRDSCLLKGCWLSVDKNNSSFLRVGGMKGLVGVWCGKLSLWAFPSVTVADVMILSAGVSWGYHGFVTY